MSSTSRVALVTGSNKGIGFAIVRDLCRQFSGDVILTARDEARGRTAVQQLQAEGLSPRFHQLDIDDLQSIRVLRDFLRKEYGGLDVLVNNAGIAFKSKGLGNAAWRMVVECQAPGWAVPVWAALEWGTCGPWDPGQTPQRSACRAPWDWEGSTNGTLCLADSYSLGSFSGFHYAIFL
jgi:NAD(P)-dependent dehydrogenase (short-subunit alcohol dehydrogenase family)